MDTIPVLRLGRGVLGLSIEHVRLAREGERWDTRLTEAVRLAERTSTQAGDVALEAWRRAVDSDDAGLFAKRLAWAGLTDGQARAMLAGDGAIPPAAWLDELTPLLDACHASATADADPSHWLAGLDAQLPDAGRSTAFAHALWPVVTAAWSQIEQLTPIAVGLLHDDASAALRRDLLTRLSRLAGRALGEQFAGDRPAGAALLMSLGAGDDHGRAAYASFAHTQCLARLEPLLDEFPVLARLLTTTVTAWRAVTVEMLDRLHADADRLQEAYGCTTPLQVLDLHTGAGDTHRGGRSVSILRLEAQPVPVTVVMKPKDMRIEAAFADLAAWFVDGPSAAPAVRILERDGEYGYASHIPHRPCEVAERDDFYRATGNLLALLHLLGTTDGHAENLIACGRRLVLIDPETLFEGLVTALPGQPRADRDRDDLGESVLRTGLLPSWTRDGPGSAAIDISALGADPAAPITHRIPGWVKPNTDAMTWGWVSAPAAITGTSLPVAAGEPNPLAEHVDALVDGFAQGYRKALDLVSRRRLLASIEGFRGLRRRIVLRGTRVYGILQMRAQSPRCLRSANARGVELDRLARSSLLGSAPGPHWDFLGAELHDMENLDIPYFDYPLGSRDIVGTDRVITGALDEDGLAQALQRVAETSERDLAWQIALIRASVGARQMRIGVTSAFESDEISSDSMDDTVTQAAIAHILECLDGTSLRDARDQRTWLSVAPFGDGSRVQLGMIDVGFYSGRAGLLAFFDAVARRTCDAGLRDTATRLIADTWHPLAEVLLDADAYVGFRLLRDIGLGLNGAGGLLTVLGNDLCGIDPHELDRARSAILKALTGGLIDRDDVGDHMGGAAGLIGPLLTMRDVSVVDVDELVRQLADRLIARQLTSGAWPTAQSRQPLTGLSHGASGFALALLRAGTALDRDELVDAGARGFAYERLLRDEASDNWPDLRNDSVPGSAMVAWCHGAPGIGLARARALELQPHHPDADDWRADLDVAVQTTAAAGIGLDHLCCGNLGRVHVLTQIAKSGKHPQAQGSADLITARVLSRWRSTGSFRLNDFGTGSTAAYASCMTGLPGIGLALLAPDDASLNALG